MHPHPYTAGDDGDQQQMQLHRGSVSSQRLSDFQFLAGRSIRNLATQTAECPSENGLVMQVSQRVAHEPKAPCRLVIKQLTHHVAILLHGWAGTQMKCTENSGKRCNKAQHGDVVMEQRLTAKIWVFCRAEW